MRYDLNKPINWKNEFAQLEAEFIKKRNEKQKQPKSKPSNVIRVDFVNKIRIK